MISTCNPRELLSDFRMRISGLGNYKCTSLLHIISFILKHKRKNSSLELTDKSLRSLVTSHFFFHLSLSSHFGHSSEGSTGGAPVHVLGAAVMAKVINIKHQLSYVQFVMNTFNLALLRLWSTLAQPTFFHSLFFLLFSVLYKCIQLNHCHLLHLYFALNLYLLHTIGYAAEITQGNLYI